MPRFIFLLLLFAAHSFAEDVQPTKPLPDSAIRVMAQHDADVAKADAVAVKGLEKALADTMKKGDLEGAEAIKAKIDELKPKGNDPFKQKFAFAGKWQANHSNGWRGIYNVTDTTVVLIPGNLTGKWSVSGSDLVISYFSGDSDTFKITSNSKKLEGVNNHGVQLSLEKIPDK